MAADACDAVARFFAESSSPILFAGAGVSARAGLPVWGAYLREVAEIIRKDDVLIANAMTEWIHSGHLTQAASLVFMSPNVRENDKLEAIAKPLRKYESGRIIGLARLPFQAFVTTNYDRSLHDAYSMATGASAIDFSVDDDALKAAAFEPHFFVARIHGRVEIPASMTLTDQHYDALLDKESYLGLLEHILTRRQVLFIGFSFLDPAIRSVLRAIERRIGLGHAGRHLALIPNDAEESFVRGLERHNIKRAPYDPKNDHEELWTCFGRLDLNKEHVERVQKDITAEPFELARKYLAACYTRMQLRGGTAPLYRAVMEGVVGHTVRAANNKGISQSRVVMSVAQELRLPEDRVSPIVEEALGALQREGVVRIVQAVEPTVFRWVRDGPDTLDEAIRHLVGETINRLIVRAGGRDDPKLPIALKNFFLLAGIQRGWDLGAAFSAGRSVHDVDVDVLIRQSCSDLPALLQDTLSTAIKSLLRHPDTRSASALATLGRASFGLELVLQSPRDALFHSTTLPQRIYLDANVLLPAITRGHALHEMYQKTVGRLHEAAASALSRVELCVYHGFLNEVVNHRRLAREQIERIGADEARDMARFYGTTNVNVFIGAYANASVQDSTLEFEQFLRRAAPYESEEALAKWLGNAGYSIVTDRGMTGGSTAFGDLYHRLEVVLADQIARGDRNLITVRHDAIQLTILDEERKAGLRSLLVSADRRLRQGLRATRFAHLGNSIVNGLGLTQLIDLLVGNPVDQRALSMLYWVSHISSPTEAVKNFLIDKALDQYDEAVAMQMGELVEGLAVQAAQEAQRVGIDLTNGETRDVATAMKIVGTFEDRFYEAMREIIQKRRDQV
jgi:predicted nucleic acid-binding protein